MYLFQHPLIRESRKARKLADGISLCDFDEQELKEIHHNLLSAGYDARVIPYCNNYKEKYKALYIEAIMAKIYDRLSEIRFMERTQTQIVERAVWKALREYKKKEEKPLTQDTWKLLFYIVGTAVGAILGKCLLF